MEHFVFNFFRYSKLNSRSSKLHNKLVVGVYIVLGGEDKTRGCYLTKLYHKNFFCPKGTAKPILLLTHLQKCLMILEITY